MSRGISAKTCVALFLVVITAFTLVISDSRSHDQGVNSITLIDNSTLGYYNDSLGTVLDGTQLQFPPANVSGGDPTIDPAPEPNLSPAASILGSWLAADPFPLNANWSDLQSIPYSWATNTETAIVYTINTGAQGISQLTGNFGVDNGLFVWVNGEYRFGALEPGAQNGLEYLGVELGSLPRGINYIQILREDHGQATGFTVNITGTIESVSGQITSPPENLTVGPSTIVLSADAWANYGNSVGRVEFFVYYDGIWHPAGVDSVEPYSVTWQTPSSLRSQQLNFAIHVVDNMNNATEFADVVYRVNFVESLDNSDVEENWIPTRAYLNQRSLAPHGDIKCSAATMAMVLAMNSVISWDYGTMSAKANEMYPRVLNANGDANVDDMVTELLRQGMNSETRGFSADAAWTTIRSEVDAGRPVIVRTAHGVVTQFGHFFVAVGYRESAGNRSVIAYDPFGRWLGTCCVNNYDLNDQDPSGRKGQWVLYDFDLAFGGYNWLITGNYANGQQQTAVPSTIPTTPPDIVSGDPINIGTYHGVTSEVEEKLFMPFIVSN